MKSAADAPLTQQQRAIWTAQQLRPDSDAFTVPLVYRLTGPIDPAALDSAARRLLDMHPQLRIRVFEDPERGLRQEVRPVPEHVLECRDVRPEDIQATVRQLVAAPLRPDGGIRTRFLLLRSAARSAVLVMLFDHIAIDASSTAVILRDFGAAYSFGGALPAFPAGNPYFDYARWQQEWQRGPEGAAQAQFWAGYLPPDGDALALVPTEDQARRSGSSVVPIPVPPGVPAAAKLLRVTPFAVLMTAYAIVLARFLRTSEPVVTFPAMDWRRPEYEPVVGLFTEMLLFRCPLPPGRMLADMVRDVAAGLLDCIEHQGASYQDLWSVIRRRNGNGAGTRVSAALAIGEAGWRDLTLTGLTVEPMAASLNDAKNDLLAYFTFDGARVTGRLLYNHDLLTAPAADRFARALSTVLDQIIDGTELPVDEVELTDQRDRSWILRRHAAKPPDDAPAAHAEILRWCRSAPDRLALTGAAGEVSYGELDRLSAALAARLRALALPPGATVAVCLPRSVGYVVSVLAALRLGLAFAAVDLGQPAARLAFVLRDTGAAIVLVRQRDSGAVPSGLPTVIVDAPSDPDGAEPTGECPDPPVAGSDVACVQPVPGDTGMPRSVLIPQHAIAGQVRWLARRFGLGEADRWYCHTPVGCAASAIEVLAPLALGATIVLSGSTARPDPGRVAAELRDHQVTIAQFAPTELKAVLAAGPDAGPGPLRLVFCRDEPLDAAVADAVRRIGASVVNLCGMPESGSAAVAWAAGPDDPPGRAVPIGTPAEDCEAYVLDDGGRLCPPGFTGELVIGGGRLALGYRNRDALTRERFVRNPFTADPDARLFRTGLLARLRGDGVIETCGPAADRITIRGLPVRQDEIRAVLWEQPGVQDVTITRWPGQAEGLVIHVAAAPEYADLHRGILDRVRSLLPTPEVACEVIRLDRFPMTPDGRLDRGELPAPARDPAADTAPRGELERRLAGLWAQVLDLDPQDIPRDVGFFRLGGSSLSLLRLHSALVAEVDPAINVTDLFKYPTLAAMAREFGAPATAADEEHPHD